MARRMLLVIVSALLLASCGDGAGDADRETNGADRDRGDFPVEVAGVEIPERPERILSGSAAHTEILFAIGAAPQVVAVDLWSDHPEEAAGLPRFDAFDASVEAMASFDPDLVIVSFDPGIVEGLSVLGIPVLVLDAPADVEGVFAQYEEIGRAVGRTSEAAALVESLRSEIADIVERAAGTTVGLTYFHELDPTLFSVGSDTFIGSLYGLLGMTSIADGAGGGYVQLSAEYVLAADPDFIFLADADCCGQSPETVTARPGWTALTAVSEGRVFEVDESTSSRWGPRIVDFLRAVAGIVEESF